VCWKYTADEWKEARAIKWKRERGEWWLYVVCLTFFYSMAEALCVFTNQSLSSLPGLTGVFFLICAINGAAEGLIIGVLFALAHYLSARSACLKNSGPGLVALSVDEACAMGDYYRKQGASCEPIMKNGLPYTLLLRVNLWRFFGPSSYVWEIVVPFRMYDAVKKALWEGKSRE
jgi:hypothetical protein